MILAAPLFITIFLVMVDQQLSDMDFLLLNVCALHLEMDETIKSENKGEMETTVKTKLYPWIFTFAMPP